MRQAALSIIVFLAGACGRGDTAGLPPRGTLHVVRGTVTAASAPAGLSVSATAIDPNSLGDLRLGNCLGFNAGEAVGVTSSTGSFLVTIGSFPNEDTLCVVVQISRSSNVVGIHTIPTAFFRAANVPPDTTTVTITVTG